MILDKSLHAIPWESLPCLEGQSVSRVASLGSLRDRILAQTAKESAQARDGVHVDRAKGTYVLNPAGDLKATQAVLEGDLKK